MQTERAAYNANKEKILNAVANLQPGESVRLRTLTGRESLRLMGLSDEDISKMLLATKEPVEYIAFNLETGEKIKKKKCNTEADIFRESGNSIVVDVLVRLFDKMFLHRGPDIGDSEQLF